ncbi:hypothetical protein QQS21_006254 [Conoideocrella luteorostrata]|uniref:4-dimethylallyltryptophan N-methyltransferase n=1 Tax=Conoideocrella luteorostrata TaxID=1105319 RepID=A0AAJ0CMY4_9HYPO|nr:hypothetical protein QQS21_006254 [Conoideocrella luteorostrata]
MAPSASKAIAHGSVVDIGGADMSSDVTERVLSTLQTPYDENCKPTLPDELLYDDVGLPIWNEIIFTPEFYQTHDEMGLFDTFGEDIARRVQPGVTMIDIGAGDTRKVEHLLAAFEKVKIPATYLALDISKESLKHNVGYLAKLHQEPDSWVTCAGIWGTFEDGQDFATRHIHGPRLFLSLGSVLCNDEWVRAVNHLKAWKAVMRPGDLLIAGMDAHMAADWTDKIEAAYHARGDLYRKFFLNGFSNINKSLGHDVFREEDWEFGCDLEDNPTTRHRVYFRAKKNVECELLNRAIQAGEEVEWFDSHKYSESNVQLMCSKAGLSVVDVWKAQNSEFRQYLIKLKDSKDPKEDGDSGVSGVS